MSPTISSVVERYLSHSEVTGLHCPERLSGVRHCLNSFAAYKIDGLTVGDLPVSDCLPHYLEDWIESHPRWKSTSTRKAKANIVNACFNWAVRGKRIQSNPFDSVRYAEAEPRSPMPDEVFAKIMAAANKRFERAVTFLRLTGCRLSGMFRLEVENIEWDRRFAILPKHKSRKKTGRPGRIFLVPAAIELLRKVIAEDQITTGIVFRNNRGNPWTRRALGDYLRKLKARLKLECPATLHGIRHQAATTAIRNGASMKYVSLFLDHASIQITDKFYAHVADDTEHIGNAASLAQVNPNRVDASE